MKKITTLFVAAVSIFAATQLMSCKKDKDKDASIVGTWQSQTLSYKITTAGVVVEDTTEAYTDNKITFNADNTYTTVDLTDATNNDNGTYSTNGSKLYIASSDGSKDTSDYTVSSTQFTTGGTDTYTSGGITTKSEYKITFARK